MSNSVARMAPVSDALAERADHELLKTVQSEPHCSSVRDAACEELVSRYQALVRSCVLRYRDSPEPQEELMQVGYVGLLKAINNFDADIGESLAAYATPCITGEIKRHFRDKRWQVHVRRSAQELRLEIRKARGDLAQ
ncbi:MAG: sigma-70 family RNA polymerase sigma factor, partial [Streptosporangiaceae bacterium]